MALMVRFENMEKRLFVVYLVGFHAKVMLVKDDCDEKSNRDLNKVDGVFFLSSFGFFFVPHHFQKRTKRKE